ncbi:hypothetical protein HRbin07_00536 [bacterium HR07]|uniref:Hypothetical conserved protein n=1 Tax=Acetithermum autotrophicum TaxID=1446466 RepID=H5SQX9_ACEAU|nr:hypothetical conserved protein [Candidatus Acetothermum autotrophicum]GBC76337.1 hypothetical protein HRbin07_00536 [bacterium HR07]
MAADFLEQVREAARAHSWITQVETHREGRVARARLRMKQSAFIDVYYNMETGSISFAYIERGKRRFGANNMKIGWHIHPFDEPGEHRPSPPLTIEEFLELLAQELAQRGKI